MRMRELGTSGIQASVVAFGAWAIGGWNWGGTSEDESVASIHAAIDLGMTFIDTAPMYGYGRSEEILGKALAGGRRNHVVLASKCGLTWDGQGTFHIYTDDVGKSADAATAKYTVCKNGRADVIRKGVEDSLRRLRTDYIDLMQTHWQDPATPIEETMGELMRLKKEGKIRAIGCSNATPDDMDKYRASGQLDTDQEKYSMLDRQREDDNLPYCAEHKLSFLAYSPLAQGLLTGAVGPDREFGPGDGRRDNPRFSQEGRRRVLAFLQSVKPIADDYGLTYGQLVAAWTLAQPGCTHILLGARTPEQVTENVKGGAATLEDEAVREITATLAAAFPRG